jgi:ribonuclease III family protein
VFYQVCHKDPNELSVSSLAYLGDCVFELYIRLYVLQKSGKPTKSVHKEAVRIVSAKAQAHSFRILLDLLDEEETHVFKRGRNSHSKSTAKNASLVDYRVATGFETLIGYLFLHKREERIKELIEKMIEYSLKHGENK